MKINLNQTIKFKLTTLGITILEKHKDSLYITLKNVSKELIDDCTFPLKDGYRTGTLWEVMSVFGQNFYIGCDNIFVNNIIEVKA